MIYLIGLSYLALELDINTLISMERRDFLKLSEDFQTNGGTHIFIDVENKSFFKKGDISDYFIDPRIDALNDILDLDRDLEIYFILKIDNYYLSWLFRWHERMDYGTEVPSICIQIPEYRDLIKDISLKLFETGAKGLILKDFGYSSLFSCFCEICRKKFESDTQIDSFSIDPTFPQEWKNRIWHEWRSAQINDFITEIRAHIRDYYPLAKLGGILHDYDKIMEYERHGHNYRLMTNSFDFVLLNTRSIERAKSEIDAEIILRTNTQKLVEIGFLIKLAKKFGNGVCFSDFMNFEEVSKAEETIDRPSEETRKEILKILTEKVFERGRYHLKEENNYFIARRRVPGGLFYIENLVFLEESQTPVGKESVEKVKSLLSKNDRLFSGFLVTNNKFTSQAIEYAKKEGIILLDGAELKKSLEKLEKDCIVELAKVKIL